jgi:hypothetical protein
MKTTLMVIATFTVLASIAKADGRQICVDSKGSTYTARVTGFAKEGTEWSAILDGQGSASISNGTDLSKILFKGNLADSTAPNIEDMSYTLKHLVAPTIDSLQEGSDVSYNDEPRVYEANGVDLICSSTMSDDEFANIAK